MEVSSGEGCGWPWVFKDNLSHADRQGLRGLYVKGEEAGTKNFFFSTGVVSFWKCQMVKTDSSGAFVGFSETIHSSLGSLSTQLGPLE